MAKFYAPKVCYFCTNNIEQIDYKDTELLQKFLSSYAKIKPTIKTGTCAKHQRILERAIKRARHLAILPFVIQ